MNFTMRLPRGMASRLAETDWGQQLLRYRDNNDHLFIAVRNDYLSVYLRGRAIFKRIEEKKGALVASFDQRYLLGKDKPSGDLYYDGKKVYRKPDEIIEHGELPLNFAGWVNRVKNYGLVNLDDEQISGTNEDLSEKASLSERALQPAVVNLEMALPGFPSVSKKTGKEISIAPRIDMVQLEPTNGGVELVFTEAKLFSNPALRASTNSNPTVEQILKYRDYLEQHREAICAAYAEACKHLVELRRLQGVEVHPLLPMAASDSTKLSLRTLPQLLIFKTREDARKSEDLWKTHEAKIRESGIAIEIVDNVGALAT